MLCVLFPPVLQHMYSPLTQRQNKNSAETKAEGKRSSKKETCTQRQTQPYAHMRACAHTHTHTHISKTAWSSRDELLEMINLKDKGCLMTWFCEGEYANFYVVIQTHHLWSSKRKEKTQNDIVRRRVHLVGQFTELIYIWRPEATKGVQSSRN